MEIRPLKAVAPVQIRSGLHEKQHVTGPVPRSGEPGLDRLLRGPDGGRPGSPLDLLAYRTGSGSLSSRHTLRSPAMSSIEVRPFRRGDRDQLTDLVNGHAAAVVPGAGVSVAVMLSQLEREPGEFIVDP